MEKAIVGPRVESDQGDGANPGISQFPNHSTQAYKDRPQKKSNR